MKHDLQRIVLAAVIPLFLLLILYILKFMEIGMDWDFTRLGVYAYGEAAELSGIFAHPLVIAVSDIFLPTQSHCFFCSWCLFYFYRHLAPYIFFTIWTGCGLLTFLIGKPGWHIGASGTSMGWRFFCFSAWVIA